MSLLIFIIEAGIFSTLLYLYLNRKTRISKKFIFTDNVVVILFTVIVAVIIDSLTNKYYTWLIYLLIPILVLGFSFSLTMIRFWRTPNRKLNAKPNEIVSPADGNVLYIKKIEKGETPISIKKGLEASLVEVTQTNILETPCWLIGINMTPFDVHKNCAPISGKIILNKHIAGMFLSLKDPKALISNERNTLVIQNDKFSVGIVQTASRLVRRIDSYVSEGENITMGDWFGMIRFGSQVDVIIPQSFTPLVEIGQQVSAKKTIIAKQ